MSEIPAKKKFPNTLLRTSTSDFIDVKKPSVRPQKSIPQVPKIPKLPKSSQLTLPDSTMNKIKNIEERLNSSDSIYKLGIQTQGVRDRERKEKIHTLKKLTSFYKKWNESVEKKYNEVKPQLNEITREELHKYFRESAQETLSKLYIEIDNKQTEISKFSQQKILEQKNRITKISIDKNIKQENDQEINELLKQIQINHEKLLLLTRFHHHK